MGQGLAMARNMGLIARTCDIQGESADEKSLNRRTWQEKRYSRTRLNEIGAKLRTLGEEVNR